MEGNRISMSPDICNGKPVISGTRITLQTIFEFLGAGDTVDEVLNEYPALVVDDIYACFQYASKLMANRYDLQEIG